MKDFIASIEHGLEMIEFDELAIAFALTVVAMANPIVPLLMLLSWLAWKIAMLNCIEDYVESIWPIIIDIQEISQMAQNAAWMERQNEAFMREIDDCTRCYVVEYQEAMHHPMSFVGGAKNSVEFLKKFLEDHPDVKCITRIAQEDMDVVLDAKP